MNEQNMDVINLHDLCSNNKEQILAAKKCICGYCSKEFNADKIKDWVDNDKTAICPHCHVDTVLPKIDGVTKENLSEFKEFWFGSIFSSPGEHDLFKE